MSPLVLRPPSAMTGVPVFAASAAESRIAVSWGTPTPATPPDSPGEQPGA